MSPTMAAQLVTDALMMAIWRRGKPDALLQTHDLCLRRAQLPRPAATSKRALSAAKLRT